MIDAVNEQPWPPDGPIPHTVPWRRRGYQPAGEYPHPPAPVGVGA